MTLFTAHNFSGDADGALLGDLIPGGTFIPSALADVSKVQGGALTWPAYQSPGDTPGLVVFDTGSTVRRMRFLVAMRSQVVIAARQRDDGMWLSYAMALTWDHGSPGCRLSTACYVHRANGTLESYNDPDNAAYGGNFTDLKPYPVSDPETVALLEIDLRADGSYVASIDGKAMRRWSGGEGAVYEQLPPSLVDTHLWGLTSIGTNDGESLIYNVKITDYTDLTYIVGAEKKRLDPAHSGLNVTISSNTPAVNSYGLSVRDRASGAEIATAAGFRAGATTTLLTSAIDPDHAGLPIVVHLTTNTGAADQEDDFYGLAPITPVLRPPRPGMNWGYINYFTPGSASRDLARSFFLGAPAGSSDPWNLPWQDALNTNVWTAADIGRQANGLPTRFSERAPAQSLRFAAPLLLDPSHYGDYVLDFRQQPGLVPHIWTVADVPAGMRTIDLDHYGPHLHRVRVLPYDRSAETVVDQGFWGFDLFPEDSSFAAPTSGGWSFSLRRPGDTSGKLYSPEVYSWFRGLGKIGIRWMSPDPINEPFFPPPPIYPAEAVPPADSLIGQPVAGIPIEYKVQLTADAGSELWIPLPRTASAGYIAATFRRAVAADPLLSIILEPTNEPWNFAFGQAGGLLADGFRRGLGKVGAVYRQDDDLPPAAALPDNGPYDALAVGERRQWRGSIYVRAGTQDTSLDPSTAGSGWSLDQDGGLAAKRCLAEIAHLIVDTCKPISDAIDPSLWGTRYRVTIGTWQINHTWVAPALDWPPENPLGARVHGVCSAMYYGYQIGVYANPYAPSSIKFAPPGPERQAAILAETWESAREELRVWQAFQLWITTTNAARGWDLEGMGYEGGLSWALGGPDTDGEGAGGFGPTPANLAWYADFKAVLDGDGMRALIRDVFVAQQEEAGGSVYWFDAFDLSFSQYIPRPLTFWKFSAGPTDLYSAKRLGLIDAVKAVGVYVPLDPGGRRRPAQQLRRLAA